MKISINGQLVDEKDGRISVFDRGYLFGEGLFETFRSYKGAIPFLDKHLERLEWSATFVGVPFPHPKEITDRVYETLRTNGLADARIKIILSGLNQEGFVPLLPTGSMEVNLVITCEPFKPWPEEDYESGIELAVIHSIKNDPPPASNIKSTSRMTKTIARKEFMEKDCFDGILLDANGHATETTMANIFWVEGHRLFTPPVSVGLLPGVTRAVVIEIARDEGIGFSERLVDEAGLKRASEIFMTGSTLEVMPVTSIDSEKIGSGIPGKLTQEMAQHYSKRLEDEINHL